MPGKISIHHIGARGGSVSELLPEQFDRDIEYIAYDADAGSVCASSIKENMKFIPACVGRTDEEIIFHCNNDPTTNSIFPFNEEYREYIIPREGHDFLYDFAHETKKIFRLRASSIDGLVKHGDVSSPDFISLDVQGAELDILSGAKSSLNSCVGVYTEVGFGPVYRGQKTFDQLHAFMLSNGFELFDLTFHHASISSQKIGLRGKLLPVFGDALYFKKPALLDRTQNQKLSFLAASWGHIELAIKAGELSDLENTSVGIFVSELLKAATCMPSRMPQQLFGNGVRYLHPKFIRSFRKRALPILLFFSVSPVERLFRNSGFASVAKLLKARRIQNSKFL